MQIMQEEADTFLYNSPVSRWFLNNPNLYSPENKFPLDSLMWHKKDLF